MEPSPQRPGQPRRGPSVKMGNFALSILEPLASPSMGDALGLLIVDDSAKTCLAFNFGTNPTWEPITAAGAGESPRGDDRGGADPIELVRPPAGLGGADAPGRRRPDRPAGAYGPQIRLHGRRHVPAPLIHRFDPAPFDACVHYRITTGLGLQYRESTPFFATVSYLLQLRCFGVKYYRQWS